MLLEETFGSLRTLRNVLDRFMVVVKLFSTNYGKMCLSLCLNRI